MPTDPATVPTLTQKEIAEAYTVALTDTRWTDGTPWVDIAPVWRNQEVAFAHRIAALAAARVDHELKDKRDKVMHMHDLYDALGVEWGRDPFSAIAALKAARVDTAEVERRAARKACNAMRDWFIGLRSVGAAQTFSEHRDRYLAREYPAPAPRECRKHEGDFFGVPLYSDPNCPTDRVVFEYDGKAVACALIHPDSTALRRNAAEVGQ